MIGTTLRPCRPLERVGAGAMDEVRPAHDEEEDRRVAGEVPDPALVVPRGFLTRFDGEAAGGSRIGHRDVVRADDAGAIASGGVQEHRFVTERVEGQTLTAALGVHVRGTLRSGGSRCLDSCCACR